MSSQAAGPVGVRVRRKGVRVAEGAEGAVSEKFWFPSETGLLLRPVALCPWVGGLICSPSSGPSCPVCGQRLPCAGERGRAWRSGRQTSKKRFWRFHRDPAAAPRSGSGHQGERAGDGTGGHWVRSSGLGPLQHQVSPRSNVSKEKAILHRVLPQPRPGRVEVGRGAAVGESPAEQRPPPSAFAAPPWLPQTVPGTCGAPDPFSGCWRRGDGSSPGR